MNTLHLPSGTTGFWNDENPPRRIVTGSQMGRRNIIPENPSAKIKLSLQRLKMSGAGDYDFAGAYWGLGTPLYCAFAYVPSMVSIMADFSACVFVRAKSRAEAKQLVRKEISGATFFR